MIKLPVEIDNILHKLTEAGHSAHMAGICARERLRGIQPIDWDIVTDADIDEIGKLFENGKKYSRMVRVESEDVSDDEGYIIDIAPLRNESLEEYLSKAVFTCNAIAMDMHNTLVDPFEGRKALKENRVSVIGDAKEAFSKDPALMMAAVRTAAETGGALDSDAKAAVLSCSGLLSKVSGKKIGEEFIGIMNAENTAEGLMLLPELDLLKYIVGEKEAKLSKKDLRKYEHTCTSIGNLEYVPERRLCIFYMHFGERKMLTYIESLEYDDYTMQCINDMIYQLPVVHFMQKKSELKQLLFEIGIERYEFLFRLDLARNYTWGGKGSRVVLKQHLLSSVLDNGDIVYEEDLPVSRQEFIEAGFADEKQMDNFIAALMKEIFESKEPKPDREQVMELAEKVSKKKEWKK